MLSACVIIDVAENSIHFLHDRQTATSLNVLHERQSASSLDYLQEPQTMEMSMNLS